MPNSNSKGDRRERELVNALDSRRWAVMRAPASGSATERELPDVLAGDGEMVVAVEAKASSGDPIYYTEGEVEKLLHFAEKFGAIPQLGARWDEEVGDPSYGADWPGWYFHHPSTVHRTPTGNYRIKKALSIEEGVRLPDL